MRLLYIDIPFPVSKMSNWVKPNFIHVHEKALNKLKQLNIVSIDNFVDKYSRFDFSFIFINYLLILFINIVN